ncbi:response regulator [Mesorhizobium sp. M0924]|uniref:response regulator n=1 Tax=unclassified Mesorhizobium TaxID=325217 RepID=UPI003338E8B3
MAAIYACSSGQNEPNRSRVVLLAEDEILIRMDVADELRQAGWTVYEVGTADEAIELLLTSLRIDLVLTDVSMPGQANGLDLAAHVRRERPGVRVVVMSGHYFPSEQDKSLMDGFFWKPAYQLVPQLEKIMKGTKQSGDRSRPDDDTL